jgi:hypothetical protein
VCTTPTTGDPTCKSLCKSLPGIDPRCSCGPPTNYSCFDQNVGTCNAIPDKTTCNKSQSFYKWCTN